MMPVHLLAALLILVPLGAAAEPPADPPALEGTSWILSTLPGYRLPAEPPATLSFTGGRVQGSDGCNRYGGPYSLVGGRFRLSGRMMATKMACPEPVMQQSEAFLQVLAETRALRTESGSLALLGAGGQILATLTAQARELGGTTWQVSGYNNGKQAVVSVLGGSALTLAFSADGRVEGSAGCNRYTGTYAAAGPSIHIDRVAATKRYCAQPDGLMAQESAFLRSLGDAAAAQIEGRRLELRGKDGALQVTATQVPNEAGFQGKD